MKINVVSVERTGSGLRIALADPILRKGEFTDMGDRFLRIIHKHGQTSYGIDNNVFTGGKDVSAINTRDALQKELDKFAKTPIRLRFTEEVCAWPTTEEQLKAWSNGMRLTSLNEVENAHLAGVPVILKVRIFSNLPFTRRDLDRLRDFVSGEVSHITDPELPEEFMACTAWLYRKRVKENPWTLAKKLQSQIKKAIV